MRKIIITITDSKKSVIEKKEFSKEQAEDAMIYWCEKVIENYTELGYNPECMNTKDSFTLKVEFYKPSEDKIMAELKA